MNVLRTSDFELATFPLRPRRKMTSRKFSFGLKSYFSLDVMGRLPEWVAQSDNGGIGRILLITDVSALDICAQCHPPFSELGDGC